MVKCVNLGVSVSSASWGEGFLPVKGSKAEGKELNADCLIDLEF